MSTPQVQTVLLFSVTCADKGSVGYNSNIFTFCHFS